MNKGQTAFERAYCEQKNHQNDRTAIEIETSR